MAPNSRPPLTSRIRASFEGKSRDLKSPTGGGFAQDPETLRAAIEEAISSDAFQAAIAGHLAKLINPGIKSALDTIQPVVEAVYSHELLLRKTNASVENLLTRIDTNADDGNGNKISVIRPGTAGTEDEAERQHGPLSSHPPNAQKKEEMERALDVPASTPEPAGTVSSESTPVPRSVAPGATGIDLEEIGRLLDQRNSEMVSKLSTLTSSVDTNNSKITEVVDGMAEMNAALAPTLQTLPSMRSFSEQSTTATSVMQAQLDQMQTDMGTILQAVPADLGTQVKAINDHVSGQDLSVLATHTSKLDSISEEIMGLKEVGGAKDDSAVTETLQMISTSLESLKENIETGAAANNDNFNTLGSQVTNVISAVEAQTGTLTELKDSHTTHGAVLGELKERNLVTSDAVPASNAPDISGLQAKVEEILDAVKASNDSHIAHTTALGEIKERSLAAPSEAAPVSGGPDISDLQAKTEEILAAVQALSESHTAHTTVLGEIKEKSFASSSEAAATPAPPDMSGMEGKIEIILATVQALNEAHSAHTTVLGEIKDRSLAAPSEGVPASSGPDISGLQAKTEEILAAVQASNESHAAHATALESIKSINTAPEVEKSLPDDSSESTAALQATTAEILAAVHKSNDSHVAHSEALEGLKAFNAAPASDATPSGDNSETVTALKALSVELASLKENIEAGLTSNGESLAGLGTKVDDVLTTLEAHRAADQSADILAGIKESNEAHVAHRTALESIRSTGPADTTEAVPAIDSSHIASLDSKLDDVLTTLEAHRAADQSAEILAGVKESNEAHAAHKTALESIKSLDTADAAPAADGGNMANLESKLDDILAKLDGQGTADQNVEILAGVKSHMEALEGLKSAPTAGDADGVNFANLETKLDTVIATLAAHHAAPADAPATDGTHFVNLEAKLDDVLTTLEAHRAADQSAEILSGVRQANEAHTSHASALDGMKSLIVVPVPDAPSSDTSNIAELETSMGNIISTLESHTAALEEIKAKNLAVPAENATTTQENGAIEAHTSNIITVLDLHKTALDDILSTLGSHTNLLTEIKEDIGAEILTGIHASNESHAAHAAKLSEIRESDVSDEVLTALHTSNDSHTNHAAAIAALHAALNESHSTHIGTLEELKSRSVEPAAATAPDTDALQTQISAIATTLEGLDATLSSIREAADASNVSHAAHIATLAEIKDASLASNEFHASHLTSLAEIKGLQSASSSAPPAETGNANFDALNTHINTLITTLETQSATLNEIKEATMNPEVLAKLQDFHSLLTAQQELLASHSTLLDTIKSENAHDDIMANITSLKAMVEESRAGVDAHGGLVKDLHEETKSSHSNLTTALSALAVGGAAGAGAGVLASGDDNSEILFEIKTIVSGSSETIAAIASQLETNNTAVNTSIATLSDELKTKIDTSGAELNTSIQAVGGDVQGVKTAVETMDGRVEQVAGLNDGVHLNEKGVFQLAEHAVVSHQVSNGVKSIEPEVEHAKDITASEAPLPEITPNIDTTSEVESAREIEASEAPIPEVVEEKEAESVPEADPIHVESVPKIEGANDIDVNEVPDASGPAPSVELETAREVESPDDIDASDAITPGVAAQNLEADVPGNVESTKDIEASELSTSEAPKSEPEDEAEVIPTDLETSGHDVLHPNSVDQLSEEPAPSETRDEPQPTTEDKDPITSNDPIHEEEVLNDSMAEVTEGESGEKGHPAAEEIVTDPTKTNDPEIEEGKEESPEEPKIGTETETKPDVVDSIVADESMADDQKIEDTPAEIPESAIDPDTETARDISSTEIDEPEHQAVPSESMPEVSIESEDHSAELEKEVESSQDDTVPASTTLDTEIDNGSKSIDEDKTEHAPASPLKETLESEKEEARDLPTPTQASSSVLDHAEKEEASDPPTPTRVASPALEQEEKDEPIDHSMATEIPSPDLEYESKEEAIGSITPARATSPVLEHEEEEEAINAPATTRPVSPVSEQDEKEEAAAPSTPAQAASPVLEQATPERISHEEETPKNLDLEASPAPEKDIQRPQTSDSEVASERLEKTPDSPVEQVAADLETAPGLDKDIQESDAASKPSLDHLEEHHEIEHAPELSTEGHNPVSQDSDEEFPSRSHQEIEEPESPAEASRSLDLEPEAGSKPDQATISPDTDFHPGEQRMDRGFEIPEVASPSPPYSPEPGLQSHRDSLDNDLYSESWEPSAKKFEDDRPLQGRDNLFSDEHEVDTPDVASPDLDYYQSRAGAEQQNPFHQGYQREVQEPAALERSGFDDYYEPDSPATQHRFQKEPSRYADEYAPQHSFSQQAPGESAFDPRDVYDQYGAETPPTQHYTEAESPRYDKAYKPDFSRGLPTDTSLGSRGIHEEYNAHPSAGYGHSAHEPVDYREEYRSQQTLPPQVQTSNLSSPDFDEQYRQGERRFTPAEPFSYSNEYFPPAHEIRDAPAVASGTEESHAIPLASPPIDYEPNSATASASTSAFASPTSPSFPGSPTSKKGKKGKKEKKEKKEKKKKEKFVFDPDEEDEDNGAPGASGAA